MSDQTLSKERKRKSPTIRNSSRIFSSAMKGILNHPVPTKNIENKHTASKNKDGLPKVKNSQKQKTAPEIRIENENCDLACTPNFHQVEGNENSKSDLILCRKSCDDVNDLPANKVFKQQTSLPTFNDEQSISLHPTEDVCISSCNHSSSDSGSPQAISGYSHPRVTEISSTCFSVADNSIPLLKPPSFPPRDSQDQPTSPVTLNISFSLPLYQTSTMSPQLHQNEVSNSQELLEDNFSLPLRPEVTPYSYMSPEYSFVFPSQPDHVLSEKSYNLSVHHEMPNQPNVLYSSSHHLPLQSKVQCTHSHVLSEDSLHVSKGSRHQSFLSEVQCKPSHVLSENSTHLPLQSEVQCTHSHVLFKDSHHVSKFSHQLSQSEVQYNPSHKFPEDSFSLPLYRELPCNPPGLPSENRLPLQIDIPPVSHPKSSYLTSTLPRQTSMLSSIPAIVSPGHLEQQCLCMSCNLNQQHRLSSVGPVTPALSSFWDTGNLSTKEEVTIEQLHHIPAIEPPVSRNNSPEYDTSSNQRLTAYSPMDTFCKESADHVVPFNRPCQKSIICSSPVDYFSHESPDQKVPSNLPYQRSKLYSPPDFYCDKPLDHSVLPNLQRSTIWSSSV